LNINSNKLINATYIEGAPGFDIDIIPSTGNNIVTSTGTILTYDPSIFGLGLNGPNGINWIIMDATDGSENMIFQSSDIQAIFIDPWYNSSIGSEPLQQAYTGFGNIYGISSIRPDARITCDGAISLTKQAGLEPSITSSCKLMFDAASTWLMESDDTKSYFLVTWKVLDELDDCTILLPTIGNILQYNGTQWVNIPNYSILDSVIFASSLLWNSLTHTLSVSNPLPTNVSNSALTTNSSGTSQWTQFTSGSSTKPAMLSYNGTAFSGSQLNTWNLTDVSNTIPTNQQVL